MYVTMSFKLGWDWYCRFLCTFGLGV